MSEKITIEMTREQANAVMMATDLLARLEIGQFKEVSWKMLGHFVDENGHFDGARRDRADELLEQVARTVFGVNMYGWPDVKEKSILHERCWAVYATIRYVLAWHDHPEGGPTVNFHKPMGYGEKMPKCMIGEDKA